MTGQNGLMQGYEGEKRKKNRGQNFIPRGLLALSVLILREQIQEGNCNFGNKLVAYTKNVTGTSSYWGKQRQQVQAFVHHKVAENDSFPSFFHSGSFAEFHWNSFHELLESFLNRTGTETIRVDKNLPVSEENIDRQALRKAFMSKFAFSELVLCV